MIQRPFPLAVAAAALLLAAAPPSRAEPPSFDCAHATGNVERAICASADLSARDRALAASFAQALTQLSEDGQQALRGGQRQWLRLLHRSCDASHRPDDGDRATWQQECLTRTYQMRQTQLDHAVERQGGLVFRRVDRFAVFPLPRTPLPYENPATLAVSYPQLVTPDTPSRQAWNRAIADRFDRIAGDAAEDVVIDYRLGWVSPRLISLEVSDYRFGHGAAHGNETLSQSHWLLEAGRPLRAGDLFVPGRDWRRAIATHCLQELSRRPRTWAESAAKLAPIVGDPARWSFGADGLTVHFDPYEVASHADGPQQVLVPWDLLRPYLVADPPVPVS